MGRRQASALNMIDSHCHLDLDAFAADLDGVMQRAVDVGITRLHIPGTTEAGWQRQHSIAKRYNNIDYSYGLHPYFLDGDARSAALRLSDVIASDANCLAVGEIGLDGVIDVDYARQLELCEIQLNIAKDADLPVILHHRKTHDQLLGLLNKVKFTCGGIVHAFSGSPQIAKAYIDRGFALGIGGTITYPRANKTRKAIALVPVDSLVMETDSPDMPMNGFQGQRNEPARLVHVVNALAELLDTSQTDIIDASSRCYCRVLGLS